jgi:chemotaxis signal transduction protein
MSSLQDALGEQRSHRNRKGYLLIQVGEQKFGIPMSQVVEVLESRRWNPLPVERTNVLGVVNLRGIVFTIYNLAALLGRAEGSPSQSGQGCIIVVNDGRRRFGLWVEKMLYVQDFPMEELHTFEESNLLVTHLIVHENESILMMDVDRVA